MGFIDEEDEILKAAHDRRGYGQYKSLHDVLNDAFNHASRGKGHERHADDEVFEKQISAVIERAGLSYCEGQAIKKIFEAHRTGSEADKLGAINYIALNIIVSRE